MLIINNKQYRLSRNEKHPHILNFANKETCQTGIVTNPISLVMAETLEECDVLLQDIWGIVEANCYDYTSTKNEGLYQRQFQSISKKIAQYFKKNKEEVITNNNPIH